MKMNEEISMPDVEIALGRMIGGKATGKNDISVVIPVFSLLRNRWHEIM
jgi:hypothetical protein